MPTDNAITVENVSKAYRIWSNPGARLKSPILRALAYLFPKSSRPRKALVARSEYYYRDFDALRNVSFKVRKGESVGIIGRNGSGKSTLLQIIAGTLQPTEGKVSVEGRVAALLELGSGFNPEFTGRENVYLNTAVLGLSRQETDDRFPLIEEFAEIGEFIDQPVKTYSSGMMMRLAFACIIHVDPDILIVDEALSVGDMRFQQKCKAWIDRLIKRGVTFLFVSHSPAEVAQITQNGLLLEHGKRLKFGPSKQVIVDYQRLLFGEEVAEETPIAEPDAPTAESSDQNDSTLEIESLPFTSESRAELLEQATALLQNPPPPSLANEIRHGNRNTEILDFGILDSSGQRITVAYSGKPHLLFFRGVAIEDFDHLFAAFVIRNVNGVELFYTNTILHKMTSPPLNKGHIFQACSQINLWLATGDYFLSVVTRDGESLEATDRRLDAFHFQVIEEADHCGGMVNLEPTFEFKLLESIKPPGPQ